MINIDDNSSPRFDGPDIVVQVVGYFANDEQALSALTAQTGFDVADMRQQLRVPELQAALLDFLLDDDARARGFCEAYAVQPEALMQARQALPGGITPHWT